MAYLNNGSRLASLTIGGIDFTSSLDQFVVSDSSANKNGIVSTSGTITLRSYGESPQMEDYDRDNFRRGTIVLVDITKPDGAVVRHPRGYLYVISSSYVPEQDALVLEVGCQLVLAAITEDVSTILPLVPIPLDPAQRTYQNISASFASAGQYIYQDNQGALQTSEFFDGDNTSGIAPGEWVSVLGLTTLQAAPLAGTGAIPDKINLSYQVPSDALVDDQKGRIEETLTESYYYTQYPSIIYTRKPIAPTPAPTPTPPSPRPSPSPGSSGCGNIPPPPGNDPGTPSPPGGGEVISCSDQYETKQQATFVPAYRKELNRTVYNGPSGQVGYTYSEVYGPAIEANGQYYSDKYSYCRYIYASQCNPNGACPMDGLQNQKLQYEEQYNYYGSANELVRTVKDTWLTKLSAAQPADWRSGVSNGVATSFRTIPSTSMYRAQRVETVYKYGANSTVQETTTYNSITSRQSGISGSASIDALSGIKTFQRRLSTTISANPVAPDIVNTVTTSTAERDREILLFSNRYLQPPTESGPYAIDEQVPVPILFENEAQIANVVDTYSQYLTFFVKGDAFGMQITETLRDEIITNWRPGMPFRYYDPKKGKVIAMRMDACSWGLDSSQAIVATNGVFMGISNGTISVPRNLVGDSRPDMGSGVLPPAPVDGSPSVGGETIIDQGSYGWVVNINIGASIVKNFWGEDGIVAIPPSGEDTQFNVHPYTTVWCSGLIVAAGDLLGTNGNGGIPLEYNGSLVVSGATVIDGDVFA